MNQSGRSFPATARPSPGRLRGGAIGSGARVDLLYHCDLTAFAAKLNWRRTSALDPHDPLLSRCYREWQRIWPLGSPSLNRRIPLGRMERYRRGRKGVHRPREPRNKLPVQFEWKHCSESDLDVQILSPFFFLFGGSPEMFQVEHFPPDPLWKSRLASYSLELE